MLRVLESFPNKFSRIPPIKRSENSPSSRAETSASFDDTKSLSTYQTDFQKSGVDICMSKAYRLLSKKQNTNNALNNNLSQSLISIKE